MSNLRPKDLIELGVPKFAVRAAQNAIRDASRGGLKKGVLRQRVTELLDDPGSFVDKPHFDSLARVLLDRKRLRRDFQPRQEPVPFRQWGEDLDANALQQMANACRLPVAVAAALMPDAHLGYGLPIGGVLATDNAVIPYAVGVDIACRMKLTVLDLPLHAIDGQIDRLRNILEGETRFGIGAQFEDRRDHEVLDDDWSVSPVTQKAKDRAWAQLGTSGSGNHFVEFGELEVASAAADTQTAPDLGLEPGRYVALLSHSGSRGAGARVANHYSRLAMELHPELPKELKHLAWFDLDSEPGQEYWQAMELMGRYAAANHACIHSHIARALRVNVLADVENHHNFAWQEEHLGRPLIVHRKGATPAHRGKLGIIPGSMATPAFVVRGRGEPTSLESAAHGAGRIMSRKQARNTFTWSEARKLLAARGVTLLSADLDEVPMVYKDIEAVMAAQHDLVDVLARFHPRLVKMAPAGEKPED